MLAFGTALGLVGGRNDFSREEVGKILCDRKEGGRYGFWNIRTHPTDAVSSYLSRAASILFFPTSKFTTGEKRKGDGF